LASGRCSRSARPPPGTWTLQRFERRNLKLGRRSRPNSMQDGHRIGVLEWHPHSTLGADRCQILWLHLDRWLGSPARAKTVPTSGSAAHAHDLPWTTCAIGHLNPVSYKSPENSRPPDSSGHFIGSFRGRRFPACQWKATLRQTAQQLSNQLISTSGHCSSATCTLLSLCAGCTTRPYGLWEDCYIHAVKR
jgi:hypothetical protein